MTKLHEMTDADWNKLHDEVVVRAREKFQASQTKEDRENPDDWKFWNSLAIENGIKRDFVQ